LIRHPSNAEKIPVHTTPLPHTTSLSLSNDRYSWPSPSLSRLPHSQHSYNYRDTPISPSYEAPFTELEGDAPITIDLTYPPSPPTFWKRHRRKILALLMVVFVLSVTAGITTGIIWRLQRVGMVHPGSMGDVDGGDGWGIKTP
jgi:hypothetical protein